MLNAYLRCVHNVAVQTRLIVCANILLKIRSDLNCQLPICDLLHDVLTNMNFVFVLLPALFFFFYTADVEM